MTKIPVTAQNVFSGEIFDVYQWKQKMFDGSFETFEVVKRKPTVQLIVVTLTKKIILLHEEQPHVGKFISLPGGIVEKNEQIILGAKRELLEETGMRAREIVIFKEKNYSSKVIWPTYYCIAKGCEVITEKNLDSGERIEVKEYSFTEFVKQVQAETFRNKQFADMMFRIEHTKGELKKFKDLLFN